MDAPNLLAWRRKGRMRTVPVSRPGVSLFYNVSSNNPFSKYRTITGSDLALVFDRVHLFTGLHLGQQQGPGRVAGETADRGGRCSLSNRGKHQIHQQRLCPQADPQVSRSGGSSRSGAHLFGITDLRTHLEMVTPTVFVASLYQRPL